MTTKTVKDLNKTKPSYRKPKNGDVFADVNDGKIPLLQPKEIGNSSSHVGESNGASYSGAVFNLSTSIIGAGIMALPATMKVLGLGLGVALIVFVAILTECSVSMLLRFSKASGSVSYGGVMGDGFGNLGRKVLQTCVVINNVGILIIYMIIIGDVLSGSTSNGVHHAGVLEGWFGEHWWNGRAFVLLVVTLGVFAPLACFKRIDSLRHSSALSVALAIFFLLITAGIAITKWLNGTVSIPRWLPNVTDINSIWKLFTVVPVMVTAYICHFNVHSIENELEDSSETESVVRTSLIMCSTVYIMTSFFGFLLFGDSILDDVLANFDTDLGIPFSSQFNDAVRVSYGLHLMLVFPVMFYPLRLNLDGLLFPSAASLVTDNCRFSLITAGLIGVVYIGANLIPSIWDAFQLTGATSAVCLGFIFPGSIALRDARGIATKKDKMMSILMIGLAVFASSVAIYSDAYALFKSKLAPNQ